MGYKDPERQKARRKQWSLDHPQQQYESAHKGYRETAFAPNHRRRWTPDEDARVLAHDIPDTELVKELQRSLTAIQIRRCRLLGNDQTQPLIGKTGRNVR